MIRLNAVEAQENFPDTLDQVAQGGETVVLHRRGEDVAALIAMDDLARLRELEDRADLDAAMRALKESEERIPYEAVRRELGLDGEP